jgi:PTH1 family peptidyl-tRNA hydrolase
MLTLILGLGNIGKKYEHTRHNLGFEVVDRVVEKLGAKKQRAQAHYEWWKAEIEPAGGEDEERLLRSREARDTRNDESVNSRNVPFDPVSKHGAGSAQGDVAPHNDGSADGRTNDGSHSKLWATKREIILAKPTTFMNCSGDAAGELIERLGITPAEILVIVDDFNLPLGAVRFRQNGSDGGHNGLASVIESIGTQAFPRLRLGVGAPSEKGEVIDYVLSRFGKAEKPIVEKMLAIAAEGVIFAVQHRLELAMSKFNSNPALSDLA